MRAKLYVLITVILISGCKSSRNINVTQSINTDNSYQKEVLVDTIISIASRINPNVESYEIIIDDTLLLTHHFAVVLDVDEVKNITRMTFGTEYVIDRDNQMLFDFELIIDSAVYSIEPREYFYGEFNPSYKKLTYSYEKESYMSESYNPINARLNITNYDSISQDYYIISGEFEFQGSKKNKMDTVSITGEFKNLRYNFYYRDLDYFKNQYEF